MRKHLLVAGLAVAALIPSFANAQQTCQERRANRVAHSIEQALKGEIKIAEAVAAKHERKHSKAFHVVAEVVIDNALSNRYTVVEVSGLDRPGLLYELTTALGRLNLNIASAHIATFGEKVVDVFYVTDLTGSKVMHASRNKTIETTLHAILNPASDSKKTPAAS